MNMDFKSAKELLDLCEENQLPISEVMRQRECILGEVPRDAVDHRMAKAWEIMRASATQPLKKPIKSMGGLIGGEAKKLETHYNKKKNICGDVLQKAMTYAMAVLEVNASMGLIVAAPTAGSAGVVPGMMLALQECYRISDQRIVDALFNAGAVGYLAMRNATVAGAVGGCQAEVGIASAMAASAAVELMGGDPQQCLDAASTVLMNMLGLVCDPVGGLVEYPCQNRNAAGVANALIAAELSLSGIRQLIPFDQMLDAMYAVGKRLPAELPEVIAKLKEKGVLFCVASGRQYASLRRDFDAYADDMLFICENGALVMQRDQRVLIDPIDPSFISSIVTATKSLEGVYPVVCRAGVALIEKTASDEFIRNTRMYYPSVEVVEDLTALGRLPDVCKVAFYDEGDAQTHELPALRAKLEGPLSIILSGEHWVDVMKPGVNKGCAMRGIQQKLGISAAECMAFGDYLNDCELLQAVGESYAMENAHPALKALARHIAPSNDENGVMRVVRAALEL